MTYLCSNRLPVSTSVLLILFPLVKNSQKVGKKPKSNTQKLYILRNHVVGNKVNHTDVQSKKAARALNLQLILQHDNFPPP